MSLDSISPNYLRVMGIPILRGRGIDEQDTESAPWVVVIDESMAHQFWPKPGSAWSGDHLQQLAG